MTHDLSYFMLETFLNKSSIIRLFAYKYQNNSPEVTLEELRSKLDPVIACGIVGIKSRFFTQSA